MGFVNLINFMMDVIQWKYIKIMIAEINRIITVFIKLKFKRLHNILIMIAFALKDI